jgi:hypothetical protein
MYLIQNAFATERRIHLILFLKVVEIIEWELVAQVKC